MKNLFWLNLFFIGLPIVLCLIGVVNEGFLFYGLLSTMLTGLFQLIVGLKMLIEEPADRRLQLYIGGVVVYFLLFFFTTSQRGELLFYPQPFFALFLTYVIYKKSGL